MLPAAKVDFPKWLYLDQNKWIDLARARYGRPDGEAFKPALAAVERAVAAGKLLVPISIVHVMETVAPNDEERRRRTAEFIVALAGNRAVLPPFSIQSIECLQAVNRLLGRPSMSSVRTALVTEGLWNVFGEELQIEGVPSTMRAEIDALVRAPGTAVQLLVDSVDRDAVRDMRADDEGATSLQDEVRRRASGILSGEQRRIVEIMGVIKDGDFGRRLVAALRRLGVAQTDFWSRIATPADLLAFIESVPTIHVFLELLIARDRDLARKIHRNDTKDMMFMSVAVPYANAIVAERYWSHQATASGLARKFDTLVETDTTRIPEILRALGCVE